jgi:hypothetical protein
MCKLRQKKRLPIGSPLKLRRTAVSLNDGISLYNVFDIDNELSTTVNFGYRRLSNTGCKSSLLSYLDDNRLTCEEI